MSTWSRSGRGMAYMLGNCGASGGGLSTSGSESSSSSFRWLLRSSVSPSPSSAAEAAEAGRVGRLSYVVGVCGAKEELGSIRRLGGRWVLIISFVVRRLEASASPARWLTKEHVPVLVKDVRAIEA